MISTAYAKIPNPSVMTSEANAKDPLIPTIIYNNLKPFAARRGREILAFIDQNAVAQKAFASTTARWIRDAVNASGRPPAEIVADLNKVLGGDASKDAERVHQSLQSVINALDALNIPRGQRADLFDVKLREKVADAASGRTTASVPATIIALWWNDRAAVQASRVRTENGRAVQVGIRPEHLRPCDPSRAFFSGQVEMVEQLGADMLIHIAHGKDMVIARLPHGEAPAVGSTMALDADPARVFLFDAGTGARVH